MTDEEAVALVPAIIASLNSQPSMAALHESSHNPFCFHIHDDDAMIDVGKLATDIIAALTAIGWQKIEPGSVVVPVDVLQWGIDLHTCQCDAPFIKCDITGCRCIHCGKPVAATKKPASGGDADGPDST